MLDFLIQILEHFAEHYGLHEGVDKISDWATRHWGHWLIKHPKLAMICAIVMLPFFVYFAVLSIRNDLRQKRMNQGSSAKD